MVFFILALMASNDEFCAQRNGDDFLERIRYATRQTEYTFISSHLKCMVWMYPPYVGVCVDVHGSVVLYILCDAM